MYIRGFFIDDWATPHFPFANRLPTTMEPAPPKLDYAATSPVRWTRAKRYVSASLILSAVTFLVGLMLLGLMVAGADNWIYRYVSPEKLPRIGMVASVLAGTLGLAGYERGRPARRRRVATGVGLALGVFLFYAIFFTTI